MIPIRVLVVPESREVHVSWLDGWMVGSAFCDPADTFDPLVGMAVAMLKSRRADHSLEKDVIQLLLVKHWAKDFSMPLEDFSLFLRMREDLKVRLATRDDWYEKKGTLTYQKGLALARAWRKLSQERAARKATVGGATWCEGMDDSSS